MNFFRNAQMSKVDRVECAAEDAGLHGLSPRQNGHNY
jgi:hypothetical protein